MSRDTFALYLINRRFVTSVKKKNSDSPTRCATGGVTQPRSYDDTVTYKHKIQIKEALKMISISKNNSYMYSNSSFNKIFSNTQLSLPKKIFTRKKF